MKYGIVNDCMIFHKINYNLFIKPNIAANHNTFNAHEFTGQIK